MSNTFKKVILARRPAGHPDPLPFLGYQQGFRDLETGYDCNQQMQILRITGTDTPLQNFRKIREILTWGD